jgi:hypothetical protein
MSKSKPLILLVLLAVSFDLCHAQGITSTAELFRRQDANPHMGELHIYQDRGIDSLISRYILYNLRLKGMEGFRVQIYRSSNKNAREEAGKIRAEFISKFPDIKSYSSFEPPSYYIIRTGDYRTRIEGTKYLLMVRKVFPDAYLVPDIINFPDLNIK